MLELMLRDMRRRCPDCESTGCLDFTDVPPCVRTYVKDDAEYNDHFGPSRDYECRNCGAAFTLTDWEEARG